MKNKFKTSVLALALTGLSYAQSGDLSDFATNEPTTKVELPVHLTQFDVIEMIHTIEEILEWQREDEFNGAACKGPEGDYAHGSIKEKWGSAYWLNEMRIKLVYALPCQ